MTLHGDNVIGYYVDGTTRASTALCHEETYRGDGVFDDPRHWSGCIINWKSKYYTQNVGKACLSNGLADGLIPTLLFAPAFSVSSMPSWVTEEDWTSTCKTGSACITITVYDDPTNLGHQDTNITCAGEVGLPEDAKTLYRSLSDPSASSESSSSCATPIASLSSATPGPTIDANNDTAAGADNDGEATDGRGCSPGAIAGLVIGSVVVVALLVAFMMARRISHRSKTRAAQGAEGGGSAGNGEWLAELPVNAKMQGVFGPSGFGGEWQPPTELDGEPNSGLNVLHSAEISELPGETQFRGPGDSELVAEGWSKEAAASSADTPRIDTPQLDTTQFDTPSIVTPMIDTRRPEIPRLDIPRPDTLWLDITWPTSD